MVIAQSGGLHKIILDSIKAQASLLISLPNQLSKALSTLNKGEIIVQDRQKTFVLNRINNNLRLLVLAILSIGFFYLSHLNTGLGKEDFFFYGGSIFLILLLFRFIFFK